MKRYLFQFITILCLFSILIYSCQSESVSMDKVLLTHCGNCHLVSNAESLTTEIWQNSILPKMADYFVWGQNSEYDYANKRFYTKKAHLPMTDSLWSMIESYYINNSPKEIKYRTEQTIEEQEYFEVLQFSELCDVPSITAVSLQKENHFWSASSGKIIKSSLSGLSVSELSTDLVPSYISQENDSLLLVLNAGQLRPHNQPLGSLNRFNVLTGHNDKIIGNLKRPVTLIKNNNDIIISEFGHTEGQLSKFRYNHQNKKSILHSIPGCYRLFYFDIDSDGKKEYITQCTQALEGIYAIDDQSEINSVRKMIAFPPEYGLSDLDTSDVNRDGLVDLVVAIGDNADYSNMAKSFHGVRIFLNRGDKRFEESYRYDWYGATQIKFIHADNDDKIDMIGSAYFPVGQEKSIQLFINNSTVDQLSFTAKGVSESALGRWMTMDKADMDNDGDEDLIFGSFVDGPTLIDSAQVHVMLDSSVDVIVLKNLKNN